MNGGKGEGFQIVIVTFTLRPSHRRRPIEKVSSFEANRGSRRPDAFNGVYQVGHAPLHTSAPSADVYVMAVKFVLATSDDIGP